MAERRPRPATIQQVTVPCELSAEMTPSDIAFELRQLRYDRREFHNVKMDQQVRDYLIGALTRQTTRRA